MALAIEAASVALGATAGNRGRGSFLADAAVSGVAVALFADAASQEQYGVAVMALMGQLFGVIATEVLTSPRAPVAVSVLPSRDGLEVGLTVRPSR